MSKADIAWEDHKATCPQCSADDPDTPLCEEGLKLLQAAIKEVALAAKGER